MQKTTLSVLLALCLILVAGSAEARTTKQHAATSSNNTLASERIETHQAAAEHHSSSGIGFGLGVSSISPLPSFNIGTTTVSSGPSLTGILQFTNLDAVQILLNIPTTQGGFSFGIGGFYKRTLFGGETAGMHVGGGLGLGTAVGNFAMNISALAGLHYTLNGTPVAFHLDGGASFGLFSAGGAAGTITNFSLAPMSNLLGASAVYMF